MAEQHVVEEMNRVSRLSFRQIEDKTVLLEKMPKKLKEFMEMDNIAEALDEEELQQIAEICLDGYQIDKDSRHDWEETMKSAFKLVDSKVEGKNTPWEGAANIKYPLVTGACIQFNARTNPEIIKQDKVVKIKLTLPTDPNNQLDDRADRLSSHMSYQLLGQSDHWVRDTDRLLIMLPMLGTCFRKSFFNPIIGQPDTVLCLPDDIVVNEKVQSLESAQRISHIIYLTTNELIEGIKAGIYSDVDIDELSSSTVNYKDTVTDEKQMNLDTATPQTYTKADKDNIDRSYDVLHELVEQHRWLDLDGDKYQEPYIVTIHRTSRKVIRITARFDENSFEYGAKGNFTKIIPIHHFTDFHFIPNPNGNFYSLGFGRLLLETNETINSCLNQLIDAGTLSNRQCGFIGSDLRIPGGDFTFKPGEWKKLPSTTGKSIAENVYPLPIKEPSAVLFQLMQFLIESARQITSVTDIMAGNTPPLNQPAATTLAMLEQAQQIYSGVLYRIYEALKKEFTKLYELNRKYLNDIEWFPMAQQLNFVRREDYELPDYGIYPVADPKLSSHLQRSMQANAMLELTKFPEMKRIEALKDYILALGKSEPEKYLELNPQPSPEQLLIIAQTKNVDMSTKNMLMERELEAIRLGISEFKEKAKTMYYGIDGAAKKVDSIVKLAAMNHVESPEEIGKATQEEEIITQSTQQQDIPQDVWHKLDALETMINNLLGNEHMKAVPPQMPPQAMQNRGNILPPHEAMSMEQNQAMGA